MAMWFTIVKVPILKLVIGDQVLRFAPVSCDIGERELPSRCLRLAEQRVCEVTHYARVRLFDYLTGAELPIREEVRYIEYALPGMRMRAWHTLIIHKVLLQDPQWRREKIVKTRTLLEVYSARGEVNSCARAFPCEEWVVLGGKKFTRTLGLFSTANDPFVCEEVVE
jgi:hypothetical protein